MNTIILITSLFVLISAGILVGLIGYWRILDKIEDEIVSRNDIDDINA